MAQLRLGPGEDLGRTLWRRQAAGLSLTLSAYVPGLTHPWRTHARPMFFLLLGGDHRDQTRREEYDQPALAAVFHPTTGPHATAVGPEGMVGLNVEFTDEWLARHDLAAGDLAGYRLLDSAPGRLLNLRLLAAAFAPGAFDEADLDTTALELLASVVTTAAPPRHPNPPGWLFASAALTAPATWLWRRVRRVKDVRPGRSRRTEWLSALLGLVNVGLLTATAYVLYQLAQAAPHPVHARLGVVWNAMAAATWLSLVLVVFVGRGCIVAWRGGW